MAKSQQGQTSKDVKAPKRTWAHETYQGRRDAQSASLVNSINQDKIEQKYKNKKMTATSTELPR